MKCYYLPLSFDERGKYFLNQFFSISFKGLKTISRYKFIVVVYPR